VSTMGQAVNTFDLIGSFRERYADDTPVHDDDKEA
jgi:hypothetical protein